MKLFKLFVFAVLFINFNTYSLEKFGDKCARLASRLRVLKRLPNAAGISSSFARQSYNGKTNFKSNHFKPVVFPAVAYITFSGDDQDAQYSHDSENEEEIIEQFFETYALLKKTFSKTTNLKQLALVPLHNNKNNIGIEIIRSEDTAQTYVNKITFSDFILFMGGEKKVEELVFNLEEVDNDINKLIDRLCSLNRLWQKIISKELVDNPLFKELAIKNQIMKVGLWVLIY